MPRPKTKIPEDLMPELEQRRSQGQSLGQLVRFLGRHGVTISESALSWQLLRNGIDLPKRRHQAARFQPGVTYTRPDGTICRTYTPEEDKIIRHFGAKGWRQSRITRALKRCGYERKPHSVLGRLMTLARHDARTQGD